MPPKRLKILVLGEPKTGKTQIVTRFGNDRFDEAYKPTIGCDFISKQISEDVTVQVWDTAGQERFSSMSGAIYRGANIAVLVCSYDNQESLPALKHFVNQVEEHAPDARCIVVINKSDIPEAERKFTPEDVELTMTTALEGTKWVRDFPAKVSAKADLEGKENFEYEQIADVINEIALK